MTGTSCPATPEVPVLQLRVIFLMQARVCDGVRQHTASPTLLYQDGANHEGVRFRSLPAHLPPNCRSRSNTQRRRLVPALASLSTHAQGKPLINHSSRAPAAPFTSITCATAPFNHTLCQNLPSRAGKPMIWGNTGPFCRRGLLEAPRGRQRESTRPKPTDCPWALTQWRCWWWLRCVTRAQGYDAPNPFGSKLPPYPARRTRHQQIAAPTVIPPRIPLHKRATEAPGLLGCGPHGPASADSPRGAGRAHGPVRAGRERADASFGRGLRRRQRLQLALARLVADGAVRRAHRRVIFHLGHARGRAARVDSRLG